MARGHHEVGADLIAAWVSPRVAWGVRAHADAKRYLCATESDYFALLSPTSRRTLIMQGGVMSAEEVAALRAHAWLADALALRRWDDRAKEPGAQARPLTERESMLRKYFGGPGATRG